MHLIHVSFRDKWDQRAYQAAKGGQDGLTRTSCVCRSMVHNSIPLATIPTD